MPAASVPFEKCFEFCLNRGSVLNRPVWSSLGGMDLLNFRSSRVLESCVINPSDWPQEKQGKHCHISETYFIATHVEICSLKSDLLHHITNCDSAKANLSGQSLMHLAPRFADDTIFFVSSSQNAKELRIWTAVTSMTYLLMCVRTFWRGCTSPRSWLVTRQSGDIAYLEDVDKHGRQGSIWAGVYAFHWCKCRQQFCETCN
jgi:hypothetical protein